MDGDDRVLATAAAAALVIDDKNPPARLNALGDSVPFWAFSERVEGDRPCPDPSASIVRSIDLLRGLLENPEQLFGRHGGCDGVLRAAMDPVFVYGMKDKYARSVRFLRRNIVEKRVQKTTCFARTYNFDR